MKCLILAGGSGDRLWPLSRKRYPKQFIEIKENRSLLQETILRNMPLCDEFLIVANEQHRFIVEGQLQAFQGLKYRCFYETVARSTAPAVAVAAFLSNPSDLILVTASDIVMEQNGYHEAVLQAMEYARTGNITMFGVPVQTPATGYGYIHYQGNTVIAYEEKPNEQDAIRYFEEGSYLWNSGMFVTMAGDFLYELEKYQPQLYMQCRSLCRKMKSLSRRIVFPEAQMEELTACSVEKAVFEKSGSLKVVKADFTWADMDELEDVFPFTKRDEKNVILKGCTDVSVMNRTSKQLVVADSLKDVMIVNTPDAIYIGKKGSDSEGQKAFLQSGNESYSQWFEQEQKVYRSWGFYEVINQEAGFKIKKVTVYPGQRMYAHSHDYRSEHWSIVSGRARIILDGETKEYNANESVFVGKGVQHQIVNDTEQELILVEVSIGEMLTENDIVPVQDGSEGEFAVGKENILKLEPVFKDYIWGGTRLKSVFGKNCDYDTVAESWEMSAHPAGQSVIAEGRLKGMLFREYIQQAGADVLGWKAAVYDEFPILIKLIDAKEQLSIQVHPDDTFAMQQEGEFGKSEMWHIIDCKEDAWLYCGFRKDVTREEVEQAIEEERLVELLQKRAVKPGDTIYIPAGTVHAIGAGILLCEIQQNSNSTYRLYDYGRTDKYGRKRELHLDKALRVIDFKQAGALLTGRQKEVGYSGYTKEILAECKYFKVVKYNVQSSVSVDIDETSFAGVVIIEGDALLTVEENRMQGTKGDTFFVPAGKKSLSITGTCTFLLVKV